MIPFEKMHSLQFYIARTTFDKFAIESVVIFVLRNFILNIVIKKTYLDTQNIENLFYILKKKKME